MTSPSPGHDMADRTGILSKELTVQDMTRVPSDWPLQLVVIGREVKRGRNLRFHGTQRQLLKHLERLNSVGSGGYWDVDRTQIPEGVDLPRGRRRKAC